MEKVKVLYMILLLALKDYSKGQIIHCYVCEGDDCNNISTMKQEICGPEKITTSKSEITTDLSTRTEETVTESTGAGQGPTEILTTARRPNGTTTAPTTTTELSETRGPQTTTAGTMRTEESSTTIKTEVTSPDSVTTKPEVKVTTSSNKSTVTGTPTTETPSKRPDKTTLKPDTTITGTEITAIASGAAKGNTTLSENRPDTTVQIVEHGTKATTTFPKEFDRTTLDSEAIYQTLGPLKPPTSPTGMKAPETTSAKTKISTDSPEIEETLSPIEPVTSIVVSASSSPSSTTPTKLSVTSDRSPAAAQTITLSTTTITSRTEAKINIANKTKTTETAATTSTTANSSQKTIHEPPTRQRFISPSDISNNYYRHFSRSRRDIGSLAYSCYSAKIKDNNQMILKKGCVSIPTEKSACQVVAEKFGGEVVGDSCRVCIKDLCNSSSIGGLSVLTVFIVILILLFNFIV